MRPDEIKEMLEHASADELIEQTDIEITPDQLVTARVESGSEYYSTNAELIATAAERHIQSGAKVADITYGKGVFWSQTDCSRFTLLKSDLISRDPSIRQANFRDLPYEDRTLDVVVFDPPYLHDPGVKNHHNANYKNSETTLKMSHSDIMALYAVGMCEARRVLRPSGQLWVKCKDEIAAGLQRMSHVEIWWIAKAIGFERVDLGIIVTQPPNPNRWLGQPQHLRKNHSYLWIFRKMS